MNKILGILGLLIFICVSTAVLSEVFVGAGNIGNVTQRVGAFGIISIGVAFVIITGGIDLSIGSVIALTAIFVPMFIKDAGLPIWLALSLILLISAVIGLIHGLLITKLDLQPFVVTLCGLLIYRGLARWIADDQTLGLGSEYDTGLREIATGDVMSWSLLVLIIGIAVVVFSIYKFLTISVSSSDGETLASNAKTPAVVGLLCGALLVGFSFLSSEVMRTAGWGLFVPLSLVFVGNGLRRVNRRMVISIGALIATSIIFYFVSQSLAPLYTDISSNEKWEIGVLTLSGKTVQTLILIAVFATVGALMGAIGAVMTSVSAAEKFSKSISPIVILTGLFGLLGMTSLAETQVPSTLIIMMVLAIISAIFLNKTIYGRYLLALGRNEEAARYSGINTSRMIVLSYVICAVASGIGGILFSLDYNSVQPAVFGNFYELYAIAAAVLGGCSLRGGEGNIAGVVIGAAVMRVLYNAINILGISTKLEFAIIGIVILVGAIADVVVKRIVARRAAAAAADAAKGEEDGSTASEP